MRSTLDAFQVFFVEESGGPRRSQYFIPISDRYGGRYRGGGRIHAAHTLQMIDVVSACKQYTVQWLGHHGTARTQTSSAIGRRHNGYCPHTVHLLHCSCAVPWSPSCSLPLILSYLSRASEQIHLSIFSNLMLFHLFVSSSIFSTQASIVIFHWSVSSCHTELLPSPLLGCTVGPQGVNDLLTPQYGELWCHAWIKRNPVTRTMEIYMIN